MQTPQNPAVGRSSHQTPSSGLRLPRGGDARLYRVDGVWVVIIATSPDLAIPAALARPGKLAVKMTHDPGVRWPDRHGQALARRVLAHGGAVALVFSTLGDALAARDRLRAEAAQ